MVRYKQTPLPCLLLKAQPIVECRKWSFHNSTISDSAKRREVKRCHTLHGACVLRRHVTNARETLTEGTTVPFRGNDASSLFAFTRDFDYDDHKVKYIAKVNGRSANKGIIIILSSYVSFLFCSKKNCSHSFFPFFPYFKETTVQEDKCARSLYLDFEEVLMRRAAISLEFLHRFLVSPLVTQEPPYLHFARILLYKTLKHDIISPLKRKLINIHWTVPVFLGTVFESFFFLLQHKERTNFEIGP